MNYLWIAIGFAVLHRLIVSGLALLGFGIGMTAFSGSSYFQIGSPIMAVSSILDFPTVIAGIVAFYFEHGSMPSLEHSGIYAIAALKAPAIWKVLWSGAVGIGISYIFMVRHRKRHGHFFGPAWRSGL